MGFELFGLVYNYHFLHHRTLPDLVDDFISFKYFPKYGVVAVEVLRVLAVVTDKKLRSSGVPAGVCHGEDSPVVNLVVAGKFTIDVVAGAATSYAVGASALYHEVGNDPMENKAVVITFLSQVGKILYGLGCILLEKLNFHHALFCVDFSYLHSNFCLAGKLMIKCVSRKKEYPSLEIAEDALIEARTHYEFGAQGGPVAVYCCDDCGNYHLTSRGPMNAKLESFIRDGKMKLHKEGNRWIEKLKRK